MANFITWDSSYEVGIEIVDKQHRHLVDLTNELYNACIGERDELGQKFKDVMKELVEYVMVHFRDEEKIMEGIRYPKFKEHKQKHEDFVKTILTSINAYTSGKQFVPNAFVRFLRDWLFDHILITDKEMAKYYASIKQ